MCLLTIVAFMRLVGKYLIGEMIMFINEEVNLLIGLLALSVKIAQL